MSDIKYIGIDVGKLDLHAVYKNITKGGKLKVKYRAFVNDAKGVLSLIRWAKKSVKSNQVVQVRIPRQSCHPFHGKAAT